jgi:hypothetical protein
LISLHPSCSFSCFSNIEQEQPRNPKAIGVCSWDKVLGELKVAAVVE